MPIFAEHLLALLGPDPLTREIMMPLIPCPDCGRDVSPSASACPNCGRPADTRPQTDEERWAESYRQQAAERRAVIASGAASTGDAAILCPHCQRRGSVTTKQVKRKKGLSGGKVLGALFTNGASLLATGLSRRESMTHATCSACKSQWDF